MIRKGQSVSDRERGVALLIVLGLVALIAAWASTAAYEDMLSLRRAENMQDALRAGQASQSAFVLAVKVLKEDVSHSQQDHLGEFWAQKTPPFPIDDGQVSGEIIDSNRYLNLNDLVDDQGVYQADVVLILKRLFQHLDIDALLVDALVDWIDRDDHPFGSGGAEDSYYFDQPYQVKNRPLERWSELRLIKGFDDEILRKLQPFVMVRPSSIGGKTSVNINTTTAEVLMAIFPQMTVADAEAYIEGRPYRAVNLSQQPWAKGVSVTGRLSTASDLFIVRTEVHFGRAVQREQFLVSRQNMNHYLISRQRLEWNQI